MLWGSAHEIPQRGVVVINTWPFVNATRAGFQVLKGPSHRRSHALDAITRGCNRCEVDQCDFTVGYGGSPDSNGETTLDAMILDGDTMEMGAVAQLRRVKPAIEVARAVMEHSAHSILAGDGALAFAKMMGFEETPLDTPHSRQIYQQWLDKRCQPNYFRNVAGQNTSCPPYKPLPSHHEVFTGAAGQPFLRTTATQKHADVANLISKENHDTIGMVVLAEDGHMAAGTSSNGANHKIAGRVGDAAVPGAGAFVDSSIGGAAATGDGDVMMRFLPSYFAVQEMGKGLHPRQACERALNRIAAFYPHFLGGMVCLNRFGEYGGAGYGWDFAFTVQSSWMAEPLVVNVTPLAPRTNAKYSYE
ncbi:hypothetical protein BBO99_00003986 [Phytophthora kernoviae]|uniref:N(4)-(Beta-N-acetylglucosaminyl)-L-asparaginase n=3 Tax=Phytophthora kernoviae TaxID=325452 RepID=A0A3F2RYM2_9STRA|nr:hypothetical protein G195_009020 [Phytophthora kernoviae 00238/432]KAG2518623.1 hypothetical protein JM16_006316 [Phytophthora kernoviae]KAG2519688.1 hypothetical protein JM18_006829 [Phytophthora kernoviae]RLN66820.1 hypothetical protein BBP00_00001971 [Phytophthora kernoviae]RLN81085.1 hypothetical protein BBO99_00003986 [Phytophthora kernoviae]